MKYLVLLLIVFAGIWWIRQQRRPPQTPHKKPEGPHVMVPCTHCGTHVPESDATQGMHGMYCSPAHCKAHEG